MGCFHSRDGPHGHDALQHQGAPGLLSLAEQCRADPVQLMLLSEVMSRMPASQTLNSRPGAWDTSAARLDVDSRTSPQMLRAASNSQTLQALAATWGSNFDINRCASTGLLYVMASQDATPVDASHVCLRQTSELDRCLEMHTLKDNPLGRSRSALVDSYQPLYHHGAAAECAIMDCPSAPCQGASTNKQRRYTGQSAADWPAIRQALTPIKEGMHTPRHLVLPGNSCPAPGTGATSGRPPYMIQLPPDQANPGSFEAGLALSTPFEVDSMSQGPSPRISHQAMSSSTPDISHSASIKGVLLSKPLLSDPTQRSFVPPSGRKVHKMHSGGLQASADSSPRRVKGGSGPSPVLSGLDRKSSSAVSQLSPAPSYPDSKLSTALSSPRDTPATPSSSNGGALNRHSSQNRTQQFQIQQMQQMQQMQQQQIQQMQQQQQQQQQQMQQQQQQQMQMQQQQQHVQRVHFAPVPGQRQAQQMVPMMMPHGRQLPAGADGYQWMGTQQAMLPHPPTSAGGAQVGVQGLSTKLKGTEQAQKHNFLTLQQSDGSLTNSRPGSYVSQPLRAGSLLHASRPGSCLDTTNRSASLTQAYMLMAHRSRQDGHAMPVVSGEFMMHSSQHGLRSMGSGTEPRQAPQLTDSPSPCKPGNSGPQLQALLQSKLREQQRQHGMVESPVHPVARSPI